jgi:hypothetical protein
MASDGQRVTLEAVFKSSGLDRLGRQFDLVNEKMRRMGSAMRSWGAGGAGPDLGKQFAASAQMGLSDERLGRARKAYQGLLGEIEKTQDPNKRARLERHLGAIQKIGEAEMHVQERLNVGAAKTGASLVSAANLRRGMRIGLGALGLPLSLGAAGRQMGEAMEQEKMISGMALRLRETSGPIKDFTEHTIELRRNIVSAGAEFAFSGRESLALADNLSQMAGGLVDMKTVFEGARALGVAPQATGQALALSRRLGGRDAQSPAQDEKMMHTLAKGISEGGMMPRSSEFIQTVVSAMQAFAPRLPSVNPDTLIGILSSLSAEGTSGRPGVGRLAPTLRGQGGMQVVNGMTSMMDDMSEAMVAIQSQIISDDPNAFARTAKGLGLAPGAGRDGGDRYAMLTALKQAGVADADGLKLAGRTIKEVTTGLDRGTRIAVESQLLKVSPQIVSALEDGGFIKRLTDEKIGFEDFKNAVDRLSDRAGTAMMTPGQQFGRLGREIAAETVSYFEAPGAMLGKYAGAAAEMIAEGRGNTPEEKANANNRRAMTGSAGLLGLGALAAPFIGASALPLAALAGLTYATGAVMDPKERGRMGEFWGGEGGRQALDIVVTINGAANPAIAAMLAAERLASEIMKLAGRATGHVKVQNGSTNPNADPHAK